MYARSPKRIAELEAVEEEIISGAPIGATLQKHKISNGSYYTWKKAAKVGGNKSPKKQKPKSPTFVEFVVPTASPDKVAVIVTTSANLQYVIGALWE